MGGGCHAAREGQPKPNVLAGGQRVSVRLDQVGDGPSIRQLVGFERQAELVSRPPDSLEVPVEQRGMAVPGAECLEETQAVLERAVEHTDLQGLIGNDFFRATQINGAPRVELRMT